MRVVQTVFHRRGKEYAEVVLWRGQMKNGFSGINLIDCNQKILRDFLSASSFPLWFSGAIQVSEEIFMQKKS